MWQIFVHPNLSSADRPVGHGSVLSGSVPLKSIDDVLQYSPKRNASLPYDDQLQRSPENLKPQLFTHIKLRLIKQFVKALSKYGDCIKKSVLEKIKFTEHN